FARLTAGSALGIKRSDNRRPGSTWAWPAPPPWRSSAAFAARTRHGPPWQWKWRGTELRIKGIAVRDVGTHGHRVAVPKQLGHDKAVPRVAEGGHDAVEMLRI